MSENNGTHDYDEVEIPPFAFKVGGHNYLLREAKGKAAVSYRNAALACHVYGPDGKIQSLRNLASVEPLLVSLCCFDEQGKPVDQKRVESWPARVQKDLFKRAKEMSGLNEEPKEREQLTQALDREDAPVKLSALRDWLNTATGVEYKELKEWLKPSEEELAKNEQAAMTVGSE